MARRRRRSWLDAGLRYHMNMPVEDREAWDDYKAAQKDPTFMALQRAVVEENYDVAWHALHDRLIDLGLERHIARVLVFVEWAREAAGGSQEFGRCRPAQNDCDIAEQCDGVSKNCPQDKMATPPARAVELTVAKNRHGDTGKVGLIFRPDLGTMREEARP